MKAKPALQIFRNTAVAATGLRKRAFGLGLSLRKGRKARETAACHALFDLEYYSKKTQVKFRNKKDGLRHFLSAPLSDLASPHPLFDVAWYLNKYPDVALERINPLIHFVAHGAIEGRSPSRYFDSQYYLATYPDVVKSRANPLIHFLERGAAEGRNPSAQFDTRWYLDTYPDVAAAKRNPLVHYAEHGEAEGRRRAGEATFRLDAKYSLPTEDFAAWRHHLDHTMRSREPAPRRHPATLDASLRMGGASPGRILIAIRVNGAGGDRDATRETAGSIADASSDCTSHVVQWFTYSAIDDLVQHVEEKHEDATFVLLMEAGDTIDAKGFARLVARLNDRVSVCVFDSYFERDDRIVPILQPGANRGQLREVDAVFSRFAIRADLLKRAAHPSRTQDPHALLTAALDLLAAGRQLSRFVHCAFPVLRTTDLSGAIADLQASRVVARPPVGTVPDASVSVIICTRNKAHLLTQLLENIVGISRRIVKEIVIVSNNTDNLHAKENLRVWSEHPQVRVIDYNQKFNFSDQCNVAALGCSGELLLMLNDDIVPITTDWLARIVARFEDPTLGAVGPLLLYPDETVQHGGMFLGHRAAAGHTLRHATLPEGDYLVTATSPRDVSCVTGAVMLLRRSIFEALNGFDIQLSTIFQDVDLCIRIGNSGYRILYDPSVVLLHMESVSIKALIAQPGIRDQRAREYEYFCRRHGRQGQGSDVYHNPSFSVEDESLRTLSLVD